MHEAGRAWRKPCPHYPFVHTIPRFHREFAFLFLCRKRKAGNFYYTKKSDKFKAIGHNYARDTAEMLHKRIETEKGIPPCSLPIPMIQRADMLFLKAAVRNIFFQTKIQQPHFPRVLFPYIPEMPGFKADACDFFFPSGYRSTKPYSYAWRCSHL